MTNERSSIIFQHFSGLLATVLARGLSKLRIAGHQRVDYMPHARRLSRRRNRHCKLDGYPVFSYRLEPHLLHWGLESRPYRLGAGTVKISRDMPAVE